MLCYKDMTFCVNTQCKRQCSRRLTQEVQAAAEKWWGSDQAPIAVSDFNCTEEPDGGRAK